MTTYSLVAITLYQYVDAGTASDETLGSGKEGVEIIIPLK